MTNACSVSRIEGNPPFGRQVMKRNETILDMTMTGINIKHIMQEKGYTVKDVQNYLNLSTPQAVYHWFDGKSLPTIDNLYALSGLFCLPVDAMLKGNRKYVFLPYYDDRFGRLYMYYERLLVLAK